MKNERERTQEDLDMLYDEIDHVEEMLRRYERFGEPLIDFEDLDDAESHLNAMQNEAMYLEACLND